MQYRQLPIKRVPLTDEEVKQRRLALMYVNERLNLLAWGRDPVARQVLTRERDHALDELIYCQQLPFGWESI